MVGMKHMQGANKMKKKLILLIGLMFLLCGCTAEVNLEIKDDDIKEQIKIDVYPEGDYTLDRLPAVFRQYVPAFANEILADAEPDIKKDEVLYYKRKQEDIVGGYRFTYSYDYKINNYKDARSVKHGFKSSNIYIDKVSKELLLSTDSSGLQYFSEEYPLLTDVTINIKTDYTVKEHNANQVTDNIYTWNLTKDDNRSIYMLIDTTEVNGVNEGNVGEIEKPPKENNDNDKDNHNNGQVATKQEEEYDTPVEKFMNKHPFIIIVGAIFLLIVVVIVVSKVAKIQKVKE